MGDHKALKLSFYRAYNESNYILEFVVITSSSSSLLMVIVNTWKLVGKEGTWFQPLLFSDLFFSLEKIKTEQVYLIVQDSQYVYIFI